MVAPSGWSGVPGALWEAHEDGPFGCLHVNWDVLANTCHACPCHAVGIVRLPVAVHAVTNGHELRSLSAPEPDARGACTLRLPSRRARDASRAWGRRSLQISASTAARCAALHHVPAHCPSMRRASPGRSRLLPAFASQEAGGSSPANGRGGPAHRIHQKPHGLRACNAEPTGLITMPTQQKWLTRSSSGC